MMTTVFSQIINATVAALFVFTIGAILDLSANGLTGSDLKTMDGGVVIGEMMMLIITALVCLIFVVLGTVGVWAAVRITSGAHAEINRFRSQGWGSSQQSNQTNNSNSSSESHDSSSGNSRSGSGATDPEPQPAFLRTVGAAP